jgi:cadmium resistance protein CadD (predicted permease)
VGIEDLTILGLVAVSFAATNVDNLALLASWRLAGRGGSWQLLMGHLLGMFVLLLLSIAFGLGARLIPTQWIGLLGVIPILLGARELHRLYQMRASPQATADSSGDRGLFLVVATTQVANGVDTVLVFGPLIGESMITSAFLITVGFASMALLWYGLAGFLETHLSQLAIVERYGHWVAPVVLIVVGLYILDNTATDLLPGM